MYSRSSSNSYNQIQVTGFPRQYTGGGNANYSPYLGACYSPISDRVYFSPFTKNAVLEYNPVNGEQVEYFFDQSIAYPNADVGLAQYSYSIMTDHLGNIYVIPYFTPTIIIFNVISKQFKYITGLIGGVIGKYYGGCVANDGKVYFFSYANQQILRYDPVLDFASYFGDTTSVVSHLMGVYGQDNCIYQVPENTSGAIRKTDLTTGTVSLISVLPTVSYLGMTHTLDGRFCIIPASNLNSVVLFNPVDNSIETIPFIGLPVNGGTGLGFRLAPNGNVYGYTGGNLTEINIKQSKIHILNTTRFQPSIATQGCTYTPIGIVFYSWSSSFINKIITVTNIGKHENEMVTFPSDISTISNSLWNKFQQNF